MDKNSSREGNGNLIAADFSWEFMVVIYHFHESCACVLAIVDCPCLSLCYCVVAPTKI